MADPTDALIDHLGKPCAACEAELAKAAAVLIVEAERAPAAPDAG